MVLQRYIGPAAAGICAGAVTGLFGTGGGMVLVPLLGLWAGVEENALFPSAICITMPLCVVTLVWGSWVPMTLSQVLPYLLGSAAGGLAAGIWGRNIPVVWLHRLLGALVLWGGIRYLC